MVVIPAGGPNWAEIVTAITTAILAGGAIATAVYARSAFLAQSCQLKIEQRERNREAEERRRAQAVQVFIVQVLAMRAVSGHEDPREVVTSQVHNTSRQPVFDLCFRWRHGDTLSLTTPRTEPLLPDGTVIEEEPVPRRVLGRNFGATAHFRDRAGLWWRVHPDGRLDGPSEGEVPSEW